MISIYIHKCPKCGAAWGHEDCDGIGDPDDPYSSICWECDPVIHKNTWRLKPGMEKDFEDSFAAWVRRTRKASE